VEGGLLFVVLVVHAVADLDALEDLLSNGGVVAVRCVVAAQGCDLPVGRRSHNHRVNYRHSIIIYSLSLRSIIISRQSCTAAISRMCIRKTLRGTWGRLSALWSVSHSSFYFAVSHFLVII
jgi:hypothetical protein